jgi:hypothetical protein
MGDGAEGGNGPDAEAAATCDDCRTRRGLVVRAVTVCR